MPESTSAVEPLPAPITPSEPHKQVIPVTQGWSTDVALKRVTADFNAAESFRRKNHDHRWDSADAKFLGWKGKRYWPGTKQERANMSTFLTMEQIESMIPKVITVLFGETYWFDADPNPTSNANESRLIQELLLWQLENTEVRWQFIRNIKSALKNGNGGLHLWWKRSQEQVPFYRDELVPVTVPVEMFGIPFQMPTGQLRRDVREEIQQVLINEPVLEYVSIRDIFVDPHCPSPRYRDARYVIHRDLVAIADLQNLREQQGMSIPDDGTLLALAKQKPLAASDTSRQNEESWRGVSYQTGGEYASGGEEQRVERMRYWTKDKLVWVLGRKHVAYNTTNPYNKIPYYGSWYVDVEDRHYALSMTDVLESEQLLQEDLLNAQLDELSLYIHKPMTKKRGMPLPLSQQRIRPGLIREVDNPSEDLLVDENKPLLTDTYAQVGASEVRAQRRTGLSELVAFGTSGSGNSANRTATGIQTQVSASLSRIGSFVENIQEHVIVPMLNDLYMYNQKFNTTQGVIEFLGQDGQVIQLDPAVLRRVQPRFKMRASNKANSRAAMLSVAPIIIQTFLNPALIAELHAEGKTIDVDEVVNMLLDATNYRGHKTALIRPLTPQEIQAMQQGAIDQTKILTQQIRGQSQAEIASEREAAGLTKELIKSNTQLQTAEIHAEASKAKSKASKPN